MYLKHFVKNTTLVKLMALTAIMMLTACTVDNISILPDRRPDYKTSRIERALELPPDLTASTIDDTLIVPELDPASTASLSAYSIERAGSGQVVLSEAVLQVQPGMHIERDGDERWLVLELEPDQAWPRIKEFWTSNGFLLAKDDPRIGVMETDWLENRADIPEGPIRDILKSVVDFAYSASTRDKFRVRLEKVNNQTEVYLTHYGVVEILQSTTPTSAGRKDSSDVIRWEPRPRDPELEAEMLNRLMVYLGASERRAELELAQPQLKSRTPQVRLAQGPQGQKGLIIEEDYSRSWRLVGLALDSSNFVVEDQDRAQGLYLVEYRDLLENDSEPGLFSSLAFWKDDPPEKGVRYQIRLAGRGPETLVVIMDASGNPDSSTTAQQILESIAEVIKS